MYTDGKKDSRSSKHFTKFCNQGKYFNPLKLSPNSDLHQISPCIINIYSIPEVMRIKDMITEGDFS